HVGRKTRIAMAALAAVLLLTGALAWGEKQAFNEATSVTAVEVPVTVINKDGKPVRGLTAADFEVYDGRSQQKVTGFDVVDLGALPKDEAGAAPRPAVPIAARRHFLLLFDLSFFQPRSLFFERGRGAGAEAVLM